MMDLTLVPPDSVDSLIKDLWPYIAMSAQRSRGRVSEEDILGFVRNGQMFLWAVHDANTVHGHIVTEVKQYPKSRILAIQYCAMTAGVMESVEAKMHAIAEQFAKEAGCTGIEFVGRPGWRRTARKYGYTSHSVVYQKHF